ncbi:MAG: winged helix-turn-helix domain-containing protein [Planctomycetales bacterium]|nr:winged helix-turn-helix domain-containing protein [Planctomycetales bacterium]
MTVKTLSLVDQIGNAAGIVWHALHKDGSLSVAKLVETVELNRDLVMQAVGWLAREGKLQITETKRGRFLALSERAEGNGQP